jgi:hypothetical protein
MLATLSAKPFAIASPLERAAAGSGRGFELKLAKNPLISAAAAMTKYSRGQCSMPSAGLPV